MGDWHRAVAYLKPKIADDDPEPCMTLEFGDSPVIREFACGLLILYVVDEGESFSYVQNRHLASGEVTDEALHRVGLDNLRAIAESKLKVRACGPIYAVVGDGNFEASLLILDDVWDTHFREYVQTDYVVAAPARDVLAFCGADSQAGLAELRAVVDRVYRPEQRHMLTPHLLRRRNRSWVLHDGA